MGSKYKILRIPYLDLELDTLGLLLYVCMIFMIISLLLSKKIYTTVVDSFIYCCALTASLFAIFKIYFNMIS